MHDCSAEVAERFPRCSAGASLARIYSYPARREDLAERCQDSMLSENPEPVVPELIRASGEGLEIELDDVVLLTYIHQKARHRANL